MSTDPQDPPRRENRIREPSYLIPSLTISGCIITGVTAFIGALVAMGDASATNSAYIGAGVCFLASAAAFGLLANAIYRQ